MLEITLETAIDLLLIVRNILYFITGGWLFFIMATGLPRARKFMTSNTEVAIYVFCCFMVWCWIFNKLIVL